MKLHVQTLGRHRLQHQVGLTLVWRHGWSTLSVRRKQQASAQATCFCRSPQTAEAALTASKRVCTPHAAAPSSRPSHCAPTPLRTAVRPRNGGNTHSQQHLAALAAMHGADALRRQE